MPCVPFYVWLRVSHSSIFQDTQQPLKPVMKPYHRWARILDDGCPTHANGEKYQEDWPQGVQRAGRGRFLGDVLWHPGTFLLYKLSSPQIWTLHLLTKRLAFLTLTKASHPMGVRYPLLLVPTFIWIQLEQHIAQKDMHSSSFPCRAIARANLGTPHHACWFSVSISW